MILTDEQRERLRVWGAGKMGWAREGTAAASKSTLPGWYDEMGRFKGRADDWHPEKSLDQAVQVADKVVMGWRLGIEDCLRGRYWARTGPANAGASLKRGYAEADNPAEALLVAVAKACGVEIGDV